jgi:hypothetical protein
MRQACYQLVAETSLGKARIALLVVIGCYWNRDVDARRGEGILQNGSGRPQLRRVRPLHADDYDLAEGTGIASRFTTKRDGRVIELASLTGDRYRGVGRRARPGQRRAARSTAPRRPRSADHRGRREPTQIGRCGVQRRLDGADQRATRWPTAASGPLACPRTWQPADSWLAGATAAVTDKRPFPIRIDFLGNAL